MIATLDEIKELLQITVTTYDNLISILIPILTDEVVEYCNNDFVVFNDIETEEHFESETISFERVQSKILDSANLFGNLNLVGGSDLKIEGSLYNDGYYTVKTKTVSEIKVENGNNITNEVAGLEIIIKRVMFPKGLKLPFSLMVKFHIDKSKGSSIKSESVGSYSFTNTEGYDHVIYSGLDKHKYIGVQ